MGQIYQCEFCHIKTTNRRDYNKHLITSKHNNRVLGVDSYICSGCGKKYKSRQGVWKHRKYGVCVDSNAVNTNAVNTNDTIMLNIHTWLNQNKQLLNISPISNKFNIGDFLNKKCIHAINITDFIHSISWTIEDIEYLGNYGCVDSSVKLISDALNKLDPYCRPIWCSDEKRQTFYIKNVDNIWEKNGDLVRAINRIKHCSNQISAFNLWKLKYPGCKESGHCKNDLLIKISIEMFDMNPNNVKKIVTYLASKTKINKGSNDI
jgi:hypothetical protein